MKSLTVKTYNLSITNSILVAVCKYHNSAFIHGSAIFSTFSFTNRVFDVFSLSFQYSNIIRFWGNVHAEIH